MKIGTTNRKGSYRMLFCLTFLLIGISVLLGIFVSEDACLAALFSGATVITLGAILRFAAESAAEIERERTEGEDVAGISPKMAKRS